MKGAALGESPLNCGKNICKGPVARGPRGVKEAENCPVLHEGLRDNGKR